VIGVAEVVAGCFGNASAAFKSYAAASCSNPLVSSGVVACGAVDSALLRFSFSMRERGTYAMGARACFCWF